MKTHQEATEQFDAVFAAADAVIAEIGTVDKKDHRGFAALLFLVRGRNAAEATGVLLDQGFEAEANRVARMIAECAIEFAFIVCNRADEEERRTRFLLQEHRDIFHNQVAYQALGGAGESAEAAAEAMTALGKQRDFAETTFKYKDRFSYVNRPFKSIARRATEVDTLCKARGLGTTGDIGFFRLLSDLAFSDGPVGSHVGGWRLTSLVDDSRTKVGAQPPHSGLVTEVASLALATLTKLVALQLEMASAAAEIDIMFSRDGIPRIPALGLPPAASQTPT